MFQSTHPRGVRRLVEPSPLTHLRVSIHAPAWGATQCGPLCQCRGLGFNPRTRVGCDPAVLSYSPSERGFNPRTRVGCDGFIGGHGSVLFLFQSTHPRGVRQATGEFPPRSLPGFQSTHPRGVRPPPKRGRELLNALFQSTHPRGVRPGAPQRTGWSGEFQSTHPRGVRLLKALMLVSSVLFQSTHPRGVRRATEGPKGAPTKVSIHAPAWGATRSGPRSSRPRTRFQSTHPRGVRLICQYLLSEKF